MGNELGQMVYYLIYPYEVRLNQQLKENNVFEEDWSWSFMEEG